MTQFVVAAILAQVAVSQPAGKPTNDAFAQLETQYESAIDRENQAHQNRLEAMKKTYLSELDRLKVAETKAGHLDEAVALRDLIRTLTNENQPETNSEKPDGMAELRTQLAGTAWQDFSGDKFRFTFADDGITCSRYHPDKTKPHTFKAILDPTGRSVYWDNGDNIQRFYFNFQDGTFRRQHFAGRETDNKPAFTTGAKLRTSSLKEIVDEK